MDPWNDVFPIENVESPSSYVSLPRGALRERKKISFFSQRALFESAMFPTSRERWDMDYYPWKLPFLHGIMMLLLSLRK